MKIWLEKLLIGKYVAFLLAVTFWYLGLVSWPVTLLVCLLAVDFKLTRRS